MQPFVYRWLCVLMALSCAQMHMPHVAGTSLVEEASKQITVVEKMHGRQKRSISLKDASVAATGTTTPEQNIYLGTPGLDFQLVEPETYVIGVSMQFAFLVSKNSQPFLEPSFGVTMTSTADCTMTNMTPTATINDGLVLFPKVTFVPNAGNTSAMCKLELTLLETATTILFQQVIAFKVVSSRRMSNFVFFSVLKDVYPDEKCMMAFKVMMNNVYLSSGAPYVGRLSIDQRSTSVCGFKGDSPIIIDSFPTTNFTTVFKLLNPNTENKVVECFVQFEVLDISQKSLMESSFLINIKSDPAFEAGKNIGLISATVIMSLFIVLGLAYGVLVICRNKTSQTSYQSLPFTTHA